jgi:hypothetical protein
MHEQVKGASNAYYHTDTVRAGHALFKIPIQVDEQSICKPASNYKKWLRTIDCFIWDEISMAHRWAIDAVDRMLQDIRENTTPFGGATMVFCGDMQQLLPVHRFAKDPAAYCVKTCTWFTSSVPLKLSDNIRAQTDPEWAAFVAGVGQGLPVIFPSHCVVPDVDALISAVWPNGDFCVGDSRSILTMTREDAHRINQRIINQFPGVADVSLSLDAALVRATAYTRM